ncbi:MAG: sulfatase, partial [bacterium]
WRKRSWRPPQLMLEAVITILVISCLVYLLMWLLTKTILRKLFTAVTTSLLLCYVALPWFYSHDITSKTEGSAHQNQYNVLVLLVDTVHARRLSTYGFEKQTSPELTQFAKHSLTYENAFSHSSWTKPSIATLFTGLYPPVHGTVSRHTKLPQNIRTLPGIFDKHGYRTMGITTNSFIRKRSGFHRGFNQFYERTYPHPQQRGQIYQLLKGTYFEHLMLSRDVKMTSARKTNDLAIKWLQKNKQHQSPFFMYLHYMDPHQPYRPPKDYLGDRTINPNFTFYKYASKHIYEFGSPYKEPYPFYNHEIPAPEILRQVQYRHHSEIRYWDHQFGRLIDFLRSSNQFNNTLIVVTSDHGEEFFQHGNWEHGHSLFNEQLHVPLIVRLPGNHKPKKQRVSHPVTHLDLRKSILQFMNMKTRNQQKSMTLPGFPSADTPTTNRQFYATNLGRTKNNQFRSVYKWPYKLIRIDHGQKTAWRLYNLNQDYKEQNNLITTQSDTFSRLRTNLEQWFKRKRSQSYNPETITFDAREKERLKGLGYME